MKKAVSLFLLFFCTLTVFAEKPVVRDIKTQTGTSTKIFITWTNPINPDTKITELRLYRNTKQISSYSQIATSELIAKLTPDKTNYTDTVSDFRDYYYAIISYTDKPYDVILISFNSTANGVHITPESPKEPEKKEYDTYYPEGTMRKMPLPYLSIDSESFDDDESSISQRAVSSAEMLTKSKSKKGTLLQMYLFEEDLVSPDAGDDYLLFEILKNYFVQKKYSEAIKQLDKLIGTNISESTRNRAIFYLGESYYLLGNYEQAVRTFVKVEQVFPNLVKEWLDSSLDRI